ncbi:hypothetical protein DERF_004041 [Dermatophagoides farinae]|uniref:Uncharacterized protein n=1 Tax=Dermatophagoides farinae TaxID=6954 RepID=A0A922IH59_DERFA|nr:hypothetical protein DERF_004041 [Dermatophagoides farinae]
MSFCRAIVWAIMSNNRNGHRALYDRCVQSLCEPANTPNPPTTAIRHDQAIVLRRAFHIAR